MKAQQNKFNRIRVALLHRGQTLASWARGQGYSRVTVWSAAKGIRNGPKSTTIMRQLSELL